MRVPSSSAAFSSFLILALHVLSVTAALPDLLNILGLLGPTTAKAVTTAKTTTSTAKTTSSTVKTTSSTVKTTSSTVQTTSTAKVTSSSTSASQSTTSPTSKSTSPALTSSLSVLASTTSSTLPSIVSNVIIVSESVASVNNQAATNQAAAPVETAAVIVEGKVASTNTSIATNATAPIVAETLAMITSSTVLVIARDTLSAYSAYSGLNGYGIPYQILSVPMGGATLPVLNGSATIGNFGAIVVLSEVSYDYGAAGFNTALTSAQWTALYTYQLMFGVRMVRLDVYPSSDSGTVAQGSCCASGEEQLISISNTTAFPTAGIIAGATMSTLGLYHYPATITNASIATEFAQFGVNNDYSHVSTAAVINKINGREQMVFFTSFATDWSATSNFLQHAWIQWVTRGVYAGFRRTYFGTQVDDMFLESSIYYPANQTFRIRVADLNVLKPWMATLNKKLPAGSTYFMEIGHNGNGNIDQSDSLDTTGKLCSGGAINYDEQIDTPLEFQKPLGTGTNIWPTTPTSYDWTVACTKKDPLLVWWTTVSNRDVFAHVSHTFTHEGENNSTYSDIFNEISFNQAWLAQVGLSSAKYFSANGLIPPAITGLHNGDALRAWVARNITHAVGDNTRPPLLNTLNEHWPLITTVANNGYAGVQITPRWATNIYYNCDTANCTVAEWIATSAGKGDITALLLLEKQTNTRHLLGLHHDPFMFHQANLRNTDVASITINGVTSQLSLIQMWVETITQEMMRLVTWPLVSIKHDDIALAFSARMARDQCGIQMYYVVDILTKAITGVHVTTNGNVCSTPVPITVPGKVTSTQGFPTEQLGSDPLTIWVTMSGSAVTFTLSTPVPW